VITFCGLASKLVSFPENVLRSGSNSKQKSTNTLWKGGTGGINAKRPSRSPGLTITNTYCENSFKETKGEWLTRSNKVKRRNIERRRERGSKIRNLEQR
jgi:hypothetical protein